MASSFSTDTLSSLIQSAGGAGYRFTAPVKDAEEIVTFQPVESADRVDLDHIQTTLSPKEHIFPAAECIFRYRTTDEGKIELVDVDPEQIARPTVIFGLRPCDAAAPQIVRRVMTWDYDDEFYTRRLDAAVLIAIACTASDAACFCTSVGLGPDSRQGADILLTPSSTEGRFLVEAVTDKGREFVERTEGWGHDTLEPSPAVAQTADRMAARFDTGRIKQWLDANFEHDFWKTATLPCVGCGICTYACPTCHCFDIVDEGNTEKGCRMKNWDYCQSQRFTLHTSGHNPRNTQSQRQRQRVMHKFKYYVDKFDSLLCTGCGRCQRSCPAHMSMVDVLEKIDTLARQ